ncbi:MAG: Vitamin B12 dependent methionine synthase activation subunit [Lachnospiraceae bacterium]|nr:Vitamin B12 dependent methionine synthase activation subunit [Lachnospiraceae bacterium]
MDVFKEALRYLGYGRSEADEEVNKKLYECYDALKKIIMPKSVIYECDAEMKNGVIKTGGIAIKSRNLSKNLAGCKRVIFMAATLGQGVDMLLRRFSKTDMPMAVIADALATAMIERYCDEICEDLKQKGYNLRPRFSPGYGDFDISHQKDFMNILDCHKKIGLTVTEGLMLVPSKSVTAIMGISDKDDRCIISGCEMCKKTDCPYRRD